MQWRDVRFSLRALMLVIAMLAVVFALAVALWPEPVEPDPPWVVDDSAQRL